MKEKYLLIMERALEAYTPDHIQEYFEKVQISGLTEHGFPRLTANIGILIAAGRRTELLPVFLDMMDLCCTSIPGRHAANDFSVKEICFAILALEKAGCIPAARLRFWKDSLQKLDPWHDYDCIAPAPDVRVGNWAAYGAASEFLRQYLGLCDASGFLNRQIPSQLLSFEENGMYRDPGEPILYDLATRTQFAVLLHFGYNGPYLEEMDACLQKSGMLTLQMQSVTGEMAFGGRSNQYLFNEAYLAAVCSFEAARYHRRGDLLLAGQFHDAADAAVDSILHWMDRLDGKRHLKNRYPMDSSYGCEGYGYSDKYMISLSSFIYLALLFHDESIVPYPCPARTGGFTARTSCYFHKFFANCSGYFLEWDTDADMHYDASGLGRIHKAGAPSELMLSVPFAHKPVYNIADGIQNSPCRFDHADRNPGQLAVCGGRIQDGVRQFACEVGSVRRISSTEESVSAVCTELINALGQKERYRITENGVEITLEDTGGITFALPLIVFNGKSGSQIECNEERNTISVFYESWIYRIYTDGVLIRTDTFYRNRNGTYNLFTANGKDRLYIRLSCEKDTGIQKTKED